VVVNPRIVLDGDRFVMGRLPECQIVLPSAAVARQHAQIVRAGSECYIEDLQSRSGTYVNQQQIHGRALLRPGDRIRICDFTLVFEDLPAGEP
jgi:pSer/pThr/pTyr-binding forkhead associated (FHA) protein